MVFSRHIDQLHYRVQCLSYFGAVFGSLFLIMMGFIWNAGRREAGQVTDAEKYLETLKDQEKKNKRRNKGVK